MGKFPERLIRLREKTGLTQRELAAKTTVGYGSVQAWEQGKGGDITRRSAEKLSKGLKETAEYIMFGETAAVTIVDHTDAEVVRGGNIIEIDEIKDSLHMLKWILSKDKKAFDNVYNSIAGAYRRTGGR